MPNLYPTVTAGYPHFGPNKDKIQQLYVIIIMMMVCTQFPCQDTRLKCIPALVYLSTKHKRLTNVAQIVSIWMHHDLLKVKASLCLSAQ